MHAVRHCPCFGRTHVSCFRHFSQLQGGNCCLSQKCRWDTEQRCCVVHVRSSMNATDVRALQSFDYPQFLSLRHCNSFKIFVFGRYCSVWWPPTTGRWVRGRVRGQNKFVYLSISFPPQENASHVGGWGWAGLARAPNAPPPSPRGHYAIAWPCPGGQAEAQAPCPTPSPCGRGGSGATRGGYVLPLVACPCPP